MRPILFEIFGVKIYGYGTMLSLGVITAIILFMKRISQSKYDIDDALDMVIYSTAGGLLGGKLLFIICNLDKYIKNPILLAHPSYGFAPYGAALGGLITIYFYCRKKNWNVVSILDKLVPGLAIGQGIGRIGCLLYGCCYGNYTDFPISIKFPDGSRSPCNVPLHPTQIYSSMFDFILGFFFLWYIDRQKKTGKITGIYLIMYSIGRFLIEYLRGDPRNSIGTFTVAQTVTIITLVAGIILLHIENEKIDVED